MGKKGFKESKEYEKKCKENNVEISIKGRPEHIETYLKNMNSKIDVLSNQVNNFQDYVSLGESKKIKKRRYKAEIKREKDKTKVKLFDYLRIIYGKFLNLGDKGLDLMIRLIGIHIPTRQDVPKEKKTIDLLFWVLLVLNARLVWIAISYGYQSLAVIGQNGFYNPKAQYFLMYKAIFDLLDLIISIFLLIFGDSFRKFIDLCTSERIGGLAALISFTLLHICIVGISYIYMNSGIYFDINLLGGWILFSFFIGIVKKGFGMYPNFNKK